MANINCEACEDLREVAPLLPIDGLTSANCTSLKNDTGLSASSGHNDCTDLDNMNDCLVGNMAAEVDAYDVCDWKTFMKKFIPNVWTTIKAIICSICGIWTNIHSLQEKVNCILNTNLSSWRTFNTYEDADKVTVDREQYVLPREGGGAPPSADEASVYVRYSPATAEFIVRMNIKKEFFLTKPDYASWYDPASKWSFVGLGGISSAYMLLETIHINKSKTGIRKVAPYMSFSSVYNGMGVNGYGISHDRGTEIEINIYLNQVVMWGGAMNENNTYSEVAFTWMTSVPIDTGASFDC